MVTQLINILGIRMRSVCASEQFILVGVVWCGSKRKVRKSVEVKSEVLRQWPFV